MSVVLEYDQTKRAKMSLAIAGSVGERPVLLQEILMMIFLMEAY